MSDKAEYFIYGALISAFVMCLIIITTMATCNKRNQNDNNIKVYYANGHVFHGGRMNG